MNNFEIILDNMRDGILLIDLNGNVLQINKSLKELLDKNKAIIDIGDDISKIELDPELKRVIERTLSSPKENDIEIWADKYSATLHLSVVPIKSTDQSNVLIIFRNTTKQRQLENVRRDFVANVSHELKTPITGIKLLADAICQSDEVKDNEIIQFSKRLGKETGRLVQLVNDLLDLSKLEAVKPSFEYFDFAGLIRELGNEFDSVAERKEISFELTIDEEIPFCFGSPEQLELLIVNLFENAIRYTLPSGRVRADLSSKKSSVFFKIEDDGIGIPKKDINRIFERFYRVDKARSRMKGGTGLGLSIVKHVVQNHDGLIDVKSDVGVGSTFTVELPLVTL